MAVRSTQSRKRAARSTQGGVALMEKWIVVHVLSLSGLRFQIKCIVTKVRKTITFCLKHSFCTKNASLPFYTDLSLPCTLLSCEC